MLNIRYDVVHTCPHNVLFFFCRGGGAERRWEGEEDSMEAQVAVDTKKNKKKITSSMRTLAY
jgi:hypothetical protein